MKTSPSPHTVHLVGAGCGTGQLLTLAAVQAIAQASVILVDDLVHPEVLAHANANATITYAGKRGGCKSTPQIQIEEWMIAHALAGERVVRLKGGDPLIFGRAGEEITALERAGIRVVIINGISAAQAASAALHISMTHRDYAHGLVLITGHAQAKNEAPKWAAIAQAAHTARLTIVVYMGIGTALQLQTELLKGLPTNTPVAVVHKAALPGQKIIGCTLDQLCESISKHELQSPCVIVIGQVLHTASTSVFSAPVSSS